MNYIADVRKWSNARIRDAVCDLQGIDRVCNVSGYNDWDKEGAFYRTYFPSCTNYAVSYFPGDDTKGRADVDCDELIPLDLTKAIDPTLRDKFSLILTHTVLEHVPNPIFSFSQLGMMTDDLLLTVVPFRQVMHFEVGDFDDYFRFSPSALRYMHEQNGFEILYESFTPSPARNCYLVVLATKKPELHVGYQRTLLDYKSLNGVVGRHGLRDSLSHLAWAIKDKFR